MPIYAFIYSCLPHYIQLPRFYPLICRLIKLNYFQRYHEKKSSAIKRNKIMDWKKDF